MGLREAFKPGAPLAAMAQYNQFITWKLKEGKNKDGSPKWDKVPTDPVSGFAIGPHTSSNWMDHETAVAAFEASSHSDGVGFVFTEQDPFVFVDIDKCRENGVWSPVANDIIAALPGAAVEISQSGKGLHIFGRCAPMPHSCKNKLYGTDD